MANPTTHSGQANAGESPLAEALGQNQEAAAEVKRAADELAVVHAVLDTKIAQGANDSDVKLAVDKTNKVEKRLGQSAEKLDQVNQTLEREIRRKP